MADFDEALRLEPRSLLALQWKAAHLSQQPEPGVKREKAYEKALLVYDEALRWYPNAAILRVDRGVLRARRGERAAALDDGLKAVRLDDSAMIHYQLACIYALISRGDAEDDDKALHHLAAALRRDLSRFNLIEGDTDLDPIRNDPRFVQIVESARALILAERPKSAPAIQTPE
jgi:tetratricopeptide (TPR) repeat protein